MQSPLEQFEILGNTMVGHILIVTILAIILVMLNGSDRYVRYNVIIFHLFNNRIRARIGMGTPQLWSTLIWNVFVMMVIQLGRTNIGLLFEPFIPMFLAIFVFVLLGNLLGNVPYCFAITSHITITITLSIGLLIGITIIGLVIGKERFGCLFLPYGTPLFLAPLLVVIESISYAARAISLGVRLAANIMSGHSLLHIIASFLLQLGSALPFYCILILLLPYALLFILFIMELIISFLQAYVLTLLAISYLANVLYAS